MQLSESVKERQKRYKPGYVPEWIRCLSFIYAAGRPEAQAAYPSAMDEQSLVAGIFGLATRRMCGLRCRHRSRWALTPPFHPCLQKTQAVVFCHIIPDVAAGFPLRNAVLFVARTFLSAQQKMLHAATDLNSVLAKLQIKFRLRKKSFIRF